MGPVEREEKKMALEFEENVVQEERIPFVDVRGIEAEENVAQAARIRVVGVGGGGGNAVNTMIESGLTGVDFIATNTDIQALHRSQAPIKIQLGRNITRGLGCGGNPEVGRRSAMADRDRVREVLDGADMVFVTAGMGGGTGTGAAPIIAEVARGCGALTVGVVTRPFDFEGKVRMRQADEGIDRLKRSVDTLITIPNRKLLSLVAKNTPLPDAFKKADEVLHNAVKGISDTITVRGLINLDFADVRTIMSEKGMALMGQGMGTGKNRAVDAARRAISSPLLEDISMEGARGILVNVTANKDFSLFEVHEAISLIQNGAHADSNIIFGVVIDEGQEEEIRITVIATGIGRPQKYIEQERKAPNLKPLSVMPGESVMNEDNEDYHVPTILRKRKGMEPPWIIDIGGASNKSQVINLDEPAFLRQASRIDSQGFACREE
jgi:cell division protein FtsZ